MRISRISGNFARLALRCRLEYPVAQSLLIAFDQQARCVDVDEWQVERAAQQRQHLDVRFDALELEHLRLLRPGGIRKLHIAEAHFGTQSKIDIQVPVDMQGTAGRRRDTTFDRTFEPVPVEDEDQNRESNNNDARHDVPAFEADSTGP